MTLPESQAALPNAAVRFKGTFKGTPPFTVKWFKDDMELMTGPTCFTGLEGLSCFLEIYSVGVTHSGVYACQVSNDAGSVRCSADLAVKGWTHIFYNQILRGCIFLTFAFLGKTSDSFFSYLSFAFLWLSSCEAVFP